MILRSTELADLVLVELEPAADERGSFTRTFDAALWQEHGLPSEVVQCSVSRNRRRGTLRGLHFQEEPHGETKLVRCSRGAIFDVVVDLRRSSPTYCRWFGQELSERNDLMLVVPRGFAHGFLTLEDASEVHYQMSTPFVPEAARGVRWNDSAFGIVWPFAPDVISERDQTLPDFTP